MGWPGTIEDRDMTADELRDKLVSAIRNEPRIFLAKDLAGAMAGDRLREDLGLDSVGLLYLVLAIEDAFDVEVDDAEQLAECFSTWGELLRFIEERVA
jgi:acyl carrier protein